MPYSIFDATDKPRLDRLRARARRHGMRLEKSRQGEHCNNRGGLMLIDAYQNTVIAGANYELDLDATEEWIGDMIRRAAA